MHVVERKGRLYMSHVSQKQFASECEAASHLRRQAWSVNRRLAVLRKVYEKWLARCPRNRELNLDDPMKRGVVVVNRTRISVIVPIGSMVLNWWSKKGPSIRQIPA